MAQALTYDARDSGVDTSDGMMARFRKSLAERRLYRATVSELSQLTDRELADLGIHRASIRDIARESVYGA